MRESVDHDVLIMENFWACFDFNRQFLFIFFLCLYFYTKFPALKVQRFKILLDCRSGSVSQIM